MLHEPVSQYLILRFVLLRQAQNACLDLETIASMSSRLLVHILDHVSLGIEILGQVNISYSCKSS